MSQVARKPWRKAQLRDFVSVEALEAKLTSLGWTVEEEVDLLVALARGDMEKTTPNTRLAALMMLRKQIAGVLALAELGPRLTLTADYPTRETAGGSGLRAQRMLNHLQPQSKEIDNVGCTGSEGGEGVEASVAVQAQGGGLGADGDSPQEAENSYAGRFKRIPCLAGERKAINGRKPPSRNLQGGGLCS
jgi:hypothetical protein